jgi:hypothetical protein
MFAFLAVVRPIQSHRRMRGAPSHCAASSSQEVRNGGPVGVSALAVVMAVAARLGRRAFAEAVLPLLGPLMEAAAAAGLGQEAASATLLPAVVEHAEALAALMDGCAVLWGGGGGGLVGGKWLSG